MNTTNAMLKIQERKEKPRTRGAPLELTEPLMVTRHSAIQSGRHLSLGPALEQRPPPRSAHQKAQKSAGDRLAASRAAFVSSCRADQGRDMGRGMLQRLCEVGSMPGLSASDASGGDGESSAHLDECETGPGEEESWPSHATEWEGRTGSTRQTAARLETASPRGRFVRRTGEVLVCELCPSGIVEGAWRGAEAGPAVLEWSP